MRRAGVEERGASFVADDDPVGCYRIDEEPTLCVRDQYMVGVIYHGVDPECHQNS